MNYAREILVFPGKNGNFGAVKPIHPAVLIRIISQYLTAHKRIVVPQLGTFVVKDPGGCVLFSELLKRDDGVLRGLLHEQGMGELEAAGEIDRFVFEVRHAVEHGQEYRLDGFGAMKPGANGTIAFDYDPAPAETAADVEGMSELGSDDASPAVPGADPQAGKPVALQPEKLAEAVRTAFAEPHVSPSVKRNPDPSVRGLRYGKPPKTTDAYTYVGHAPRRKTDRFIWIAVLAVLIALGAIAFGYWHEQQENRLDEPYAEQPVPPAEQVPASTTEPNDK